MVMPTTTVYASITGYQADGSTELYAPTVISNSSYRFMTCNVKGVPQSHFDKPISVYASWLTKDGTLVSGDTRDIYINEDFQ